MKIILVFLLATLALGASAQKSIDTLYPPMRKYHVNLFIDQTSKQHFDVRKFDSLNSAGVTIRLISQVVSHDTSTWTVDFPETAKLLMKRKGSRSPGQPRGN